MRILLTGATGYIGKRLLPVLIEEGHEIICCVRDRSRFEVKPSWISQLEIFEVDFSEPVDMTTAPKDFDVAFYLMHSLSSAIDEFESLEKTVATNFKGFIDQADAQQIIYLSGIVNDDKLSKHLESRLQVEHVLQKSKVPLTTLRAGIIVGSGSASFEIIRDLVEKLPVMVAPRWVDTKCQPLAIRNVIQFLTGVMLREDCLGQTFDIGCKEILTYKEMLMGYARVRNLKRWIFTVPVMTPRLSSYWLYFVTSTTYELAVNLVNSMKIDVICEENELAEKLGIELIEYEEAVSLAFEKIEQNVVISSWKDSLVSSSQGRNLDDYIEVPKYGCFVDSKQLKIKNNSVEQVLDNIWSIGGQRGWYYANWLWKLRGYLDKLVGGIGLRRGRTHPDKIFPGDALDFWRVIVADKQKKRLLLHAEMKLPGDAWLEFNIDDESEQPVLYQTATFRPDGIMGRLYWYSILPLHYFIFNGMIRNVENFDSGKPPQPTEEIYQHMEA